MSLILALAKFSKDFLIMHVKHLRVHGLFFDKQISGPGESTEEFFSCKNLLFPSNMFMTFSAFFCLCINILCFLLDAEMVRSFLQSLASSSMLALQRWLFVSGINKRNAWSKYQKRRFVYVINTYYVKWVLPKDCLSNRAKLLTSSPIKSLKLVSY